MNKVICILLIFIGIVALGLGAWETSEVIANCISNSDTSTLEISWSIMGAMGSWAGSFFGAIALVISILAFLLPQRVKIEVSVMTATLITEMSEISVDTYDVVVKNVGMRPVTVQNVYLHFGNTKNGDIFVGVLNQGSVLQQYTVQFPKRLESGEFFDYYLLKDRLDNALAHYESKTSLNAPLSIRVSECVNGHHYYKTKLKLKDFIGK